MTTLERIYTIPLGDAYLVPRNKRGRRAVNLVRDFIAKHMKAKDERLSISMAINSYILKCGIEKPPRKIKIRVIKEDGETIKVYMSDEKIVEKKKEDKKGDEKKPEVKKDEPKKEEKTAKPEEKRVEKK